MSGFSLVLYSLTSVVTNDQADLAVRVLVAAAQHRADSVVHHCNWAYVIVL